MYVHRSFYHWFWSLVPVLSISHHRTLSTCAATETNVKSTWITFNVFNSHRNEIDFCELLQDMFPVGDWPVGEIPPLVDVLSGEADGVLFRLCPAVGTSSVGFFGSSGTAGLDCNKPKNTLSTIYPQNLNQKMIIMIAHLLLLLLLLIFICYFCSISGGELIGCLQSSNESLLCSCRLLARDWRKTWKIKADLSFWLALQFLNTRFTLLVEYKTHLVALIQRLTDSF